MRHVREKLAFQPIGLLHPLVLFLELQVLALQLQLNLFAVGNIANGAGDQRPIFGLNWAQADLDGKLGAVLVRKP